MDGRNLFGKKLNYLFSYDVDLGAARAKAAGPTSPDGSPVMTSAVSDATSLGSSNVYNALGEASAMGHDALSGNVEFMQDTIRYLPRNDHAEIFGRLVIRSSEGQLVQGEYSGIARAGRGWVAVRSSYAAAHDRHTQEPRVDAKAHLRFRFETGSTKYHWLVGYQCVGFGKLEICAGEPAWGTFDIYALT